VLVVDDHALVLEGLVSLLSAQADMEVVGQAGTAREAIKLAEQLRPDLLLIDFALPDGSGDGAVRAIRALLPDTKAVFLTVHDDDERFQAAIAAGATGYLLKSIRAADLIKKLRCVANGEVALSPPLGRRVLAKLSSRSLEAPQPPAPAAAEPIVPLDPAVLAVLSDREITLLRLIGQGYTNRRIADALKLSLRTVEYHRANLAHRLGLHNRAELVRYAISQGLLPRLAWPAKA
jgi:two-component system response regulator NreC